MEITGEEVSSVARMSMNQLFYEFNKSWPKKVNCNCQGALHPLCGNCTQCGRVSCENDLVDKRKCCFCGSEFYSSKGTNESTTLKHDQAVQHREKLLESDFSRTAIKVFDENIDHAEDDESEEEIYLEISIDEHGKAVKNLISSKQPM